MNNEEAFIRGKMAHENPFSVPEGYFDSIAGKVMSQLPETRARQRRLRPWMYAAACACIVLFSVTLYFGRTETETAASPVVAESADGSYIDEAADYAMLDNQEIYACLASE